MAALRQLLGTATAITALVLVPGAESATPLSVSVSLAEGDCRVRRAGKATWDLIESGAHLFDNDIIRVGDSAHARLQWADEGVIYVRSGTQLQVNLAPDPEQSIHAKHATIFVGAAFFLFKHTLPRLSALRTRTRIYTPTAVIAIRGTSFEVAVEKGTGRTDVRVLNGTVLVGNILQSHYRFVTAGRQSRIALNEEPIAPVPTPAKELEILSGWVPASVIEQESARRDSLLMDVHDSLMDADPQRLAVMPTLNRSTYKGSWDIPRGLPQHLTESLNKHHIVTAVIADTTDPSAAAAAGKSRYVLSSSLVSFEIIQRAHISAPADSYVETATAVVALHLQLIDIVEGILVWEETVKEEVTEPQEPKHSWAGIESAAFSLQDRTFIDSILGRAVARVLTRATEWIERYIGG